MNEAIEYLTSHIRSVAAELANEPSRELERKLLALVMSINVLEIYLYDKAVTKYEEAINYVYH